MKILVVGGGGREHALVWKIKQSPILETLYCYPGNAGIAKDARIAPIAEDTIEAILAFAKKEEIDLTVVGPERYLAQGIADLFAAEGLALFGVNKTAAQLEASKAFAKELMAAEHIPTARHFTVETLEEGRKILKSMKYPLVIKADGLAEGKGVSIVTNPEEGSRELEAMLAGRFKDAGKTVVIEEFLTGEELSLLVFTDGTSYRPMVFAQDHKKAGDGDTGPNTGGMGAYCPVSIGTTALLNEVERVIIKPLLAALKKRNIDYRGMLYIGLMIVDGKPLVLEYNARFGDPETEALLMLMASDIIPYLEATAKKTLGDLPQIEWYEGSAATVVLASGGYPGHYEKGKNISGLEQRGLSVVFHAGTTRDAAGIFKTNGGRVLMVTTRGTTLADTLRNAYKRIDSITFDGMFYRRDIGSRELDRK